MLHLLAVTLARKKNPPFVPFLFLPLGFLKEKKVSSFRAFVLRLSAACCPPYTILQIKKPSCSFKRQCVSGRPLFPVDCLCCTCSQSHLLGRRILLLFLFLFLPLGFLKEKKVSSFRAFVLRLSAACCPPYTILQIKKPSCSFKRQCVSGRPLFPVDCLCCTCSQSHLLGRRIFLF